MSLGIRAKAANTWEDFKNHTHAQSRYRVRSSTRRMGFHLRVTFIPDTSLLNVQSKPIKSQLAKSEGFRLLLV